MNDKDNPRSRSDNSSWDDDIESEEDTNSRFGSHPEKHIGVKLSKFSQRIPPLRGVRGVFLRAKII